MDKFVFHYYITKNNGSMEEGYIAAKNLWEAIGSINHKLDEYEDGGARSVEVEQMGKLD